MTETAAKVYQLPAFGVVDEPALLFDPSDRRCSHLHPLQGLTKFGPFSRNVMGMVPNPIRIATIAPQGQTGRIESLIRELEGQHSPRERKIYLPQFPGFSKVFRSALTHAPGAARVELPASLDRDMSAAAQPYQVLADAVMNCIHAIRTVRGEFDLVMLYLPERWSRGFEVKDGDFDLHDFLKATCASLGIPLQILRDRESGALSYYCRCSVAWRLGIALYCKAGGIPWTMADAEPDVAYIGLSYALRGNTKAETRFAICCSQVFDAEGAGLDFIAYEAEDVKIIGHNPFLSRQQMMKVMSRSLDIYQRRHSGKKPHRIVVHKNTEFRRDEVDGCFDAFAAVKDVELVYVQQNVPWRGIYMPRAQQLDGYPVPRGTYLVADGTNALLWTQGNARSIVGGDRSYYKEGKGIPEPLMLRRFAGQGDMAMTCRAVLALSKMDWNNDGPYDRLPVTMSYASVLANVVKRMTRLGTHPYPFRLFM